MRLRELRGRGVEPLSVRDRFERAEQEDYYEGPYANLCWHSHNNINVLEQRHLRQDEKGVNLVVGAPLNDDDVQIIIDTTAGMAANSVAAAKELVQSGRPSGIENLGKRLEALRELWKGRT